VNERWVCKRCFADNDDTTSACQNCGLVRGSEATEADKTGWAAATAEAQQGPGWQRWLRFWWVPALVVVLAVGYFTAARRDADGAINTAGTVSVEELRVGDCFNASDEEEIADVDGTPCDQPHDYEIFAVTSHDGGSYPTDNEMDVIFETTCIPAFESYVGVPYADSVIYASMITPSEGSWSDGDREFMCYLYEPTDDTLTENVAQTASFRNANR
jgi:hypothetical protein